MAKKQTSLHTANVNKNKVHYFTVNMTYAECEELYRHQIKFVVVTNSEGKRIQLPKQHLKKFITPSGLRGNFKLQTDQNSKFMSIINV